MLTLVSHHLCPYVQRAVIALTEKNVRFERLTVDLADPPDWFRRMSPLGKVPLLKVGDDVIFESAAILEYLEETQPHPLHPADPLVRARHRAWIEFGSSVLQDIWVIETTADVSAFEAKRKLVAEKFGRIETALGAGSYFAGERFCLVDAVFGPVFRYFDVFDRHFDLGTFADVPRVVRWRSALAERPSVKGATAADYPSRLEAFLRRQNGCFAAAMLNAA